MLVSLNSSTASATKADASSSTLAATTFLDSVGQSATPSAESVFQDVFAKGAAHSEREAAVAGVVNPTDLQTTEPEMDAEQWLLNALDQQLVNIQVRDTHGQLRDAHEQLANEQARGTPEQPLDTSEQALIAQEFLRGTAGQLSGTNELPLGMQQQTSDVKSPLEIMASGNSRELSPRAVAASTDASQRMDSALASARDSRLPFSASVNANSNINANPNEATATQTTPSAAEKYLATSPAVALWMNRAVGGEQALANSIQSGAEASAADAVLAESGAFTNLMADAAGERAASSVSATAVNGAITGIGEKTVSENSALAALKLPSAEAKWGEQLLHTLRDQVQVQLQQRIQNATIRLDPPELGSLEIFLSHESGRLSVHINASQPDVARLLQQTSDRLRHELGGGQFTQVNVQTSADGQSGQQHSRHNAQRLSVDDIIQTNMQTNSQPVTERARFQTGQSSDVLITV